MPFFAPPASKFAARLGLLASIIAVAFCAPAAADIIFDTGLTQLGVGFGDDPRMLTVQRMGNSASLAPLEEGCDGNMAGALQINQCIGSPAKVQEATNPGLNSYDVPASNDLDTDSMGGPKNALVNLGADSITNANQIALVYNPSQTGASPATDIVDITMKFYDANGNFVTSVAGGCGNGCKFDSSDPLFFATTGPTLGMGNLGNGGAGWVLDLDAFEAAQVDLACGMTATSLGNCVSIALETTIWNANDGPDSFYLTTRAAIVPEPVTLSLFSVGLLGIAGLASMRRKAKRA